jgi:AcrR family transcriptional regulator
MTAKKSRPDNLPEACVQEALAIIESEGLERLSLREVARRLGVSHQAPYKHFQSRDHLLAEVVSRAFASFAEHLDTDSHPEAHDELHELGLAYLSYARTHPLQYRLMFGTPLPDPKQHPEMMRNAQHAFSLLKDRLKRRAAEEGENTSGPDLDTRATLDAMFVWSTVHGMASALESDVMETLNMPPQLVEAAVATTFARIGFGLAGDPFAEGPPES